MNKVLISILSILTILISGTFAFAYNNEFGYNYMDKKNNSDRSFQEELQNVIENGSYEDFLELRENLNFRIARWVNSEEDFNELKLNHKNNNYDGVYNNLRMGGCRNRI